MKANPPLPAEMLADLDKLAIFAAQQRVNGWQRAYGADAVVEAQAEVDRRRRKLIANEPGAAAEESQK
jgi:hypothetical protein